MFDTNLLTADSLDTLERRAEIGISCIGLAAYGDTGSDELPEDERETYAKDAISDILTALFGPAGSYVENHDGETGLIPEPFALNEARRLVEEAFASWQGDAEDYTRQPDDYGTSRQNLCGSCGQGTDHIEGRCRSCGGPWSPRR